MKGLTNDAPATGQLVLGLEAEYHPFHKLAFSLNFDDEPVLQSGLTIDRSKLTQHYPRVALLTIEHEIGEPKVWKTYSIR